MKIAKDGRVFTRKAYCHALLRVPSADMSLWISAAAKIGISRAEFMRRALRKAAVQALRDEEIEPK
jgi:hypothetical protein